VPVEGQGKTLLGGFRAETERRGVLSVSSRRGGRRHCRNVWKATHRPDVGPNLKKMRKGGVGTGIGRLPGSPDRSLNTTPAPRGLGPKAIPKAYILAVERSRVNRTAVSLNAEMKMRAGRATALANGRDGVAKRDCVAPLNNDRREMSKRGLVGQRRVLEAKVEAASLGAANRRHDPASGGHYGRARSGRKVDACVKRIVVGDRMATRPVLGGEVPGRVWDGGTSGKVAHRRPKRAQLWDLGAGPERVKHAGWRRVELLVVGHRWGGAVNGRKRRGDQQGPHQKQKCWRPPGHPPAVPRTPDHVMNTDAKTSKQGIGKTNFPGEAVVTWVSGGIAAIGIRIAAEGCLNGLNEGSVMANGGHRRRGSRTGLRAVRKRGSRHAARRTRKRNEQLKTVEGGNGDPRRQSGRAGVGLADGRTGIAALLIKIQKEALVQAFGNGHRPGVINDGASNDEASRRDGTGNDLQK
jgi:hypothetical protein